MPVGSRNDCFARAQRICQSSGNYLFLIAVGSDIDVGGADEFNQLFRTYKPIVKNHLRLNSQFLGQGLQIGPILFSLAAKNMWMGSPGNDINDILMSG